MASLQRTPFRKDFLPSEIDAIRRAIEPLEESGSEGTPAATRRNCPGRDKHSRKVSLSDGQTRDKIGAFAGISGRSLAKTQAVVEAAETRRSARLCPKLLTFNGHSFDLPVLRYRAMSTGYRRQACKSGSIFTVYTEDALDLCDVLGSYVPGVKVKLDEVSRILGVNR